MPPPAHGSREKKLSDGLKKLQEFQRRKEQSTGSAESGAGRLTSPHMTQVEQQRQRLTPQSLAPSTAAVLPAPGPSSQPAPFVALNVMPSPTNSDVGARIQGLIEQLAGVASSGATKDLQQLEVVQRYCSQLAREASDAQRERQALAYEFESLRATHLQSTRTIELLVEEKSRLLSSLESLEAQLRAKSHEAVVRDAEVRALRERSAITEGQMALLLQEKEKWSTRTTSSQPPAGHSVSGAPNVGRLQEQVADLEEQLRLSTEKISYLQRVEEQSRAAYEAARNELKVAQAYVQQLAGTSAEDSSGPEGLASAGEQALKSQLERLREELETEKHERSAAELIARNLEASNRGLQERVVELERSMSSPQTASRQSLSPSHAYGGHERREMETQTEESTQPGAAIQEDSPMLTDLKHQLEALQMQLTQSQEQLRNERERWSQEVNCLQSRMAANADDLQRAKLDVSRAVAQNKQLKTQIEELQDVFVKLSNDKLDLTEDVHREKHRARQLEAQLQQLQAQDQAKAVATSADESSTSAPAPDQSSGDAVRLHQLTCRIQELEGQLADWKIRYSHLERQHAQASLHHRVETRLQQTRTSGPQRPGDDEGNRDTSRTSGDSPGGSCSLSEYEFIDTPSHVHGQTASHQRQPLASGDAVNNNSNNNNNENTNTGSVRSETTGEFAESIGDALSVIDNLSSTSSHSEQVQADADQSTAKEVSSGTAVDLRHEGRLAEAALKIARLQEEKSQLEHQVEQLRMETDTISDYIQLYQQQRAALNQRQRERDAYIKQILEDREALSTKVNQLQTLIAKILPVSPGQQAGPESSEGAVSTAGDGVQAGSEETKSVSPTPKEVIAHKILQALEDLTEASTAPPAGIDTFYRCSSCQGCQGRLLSL